MSQDDAKPLPENFRRLADRHANELMTFRNDNRSILTFEQQGLIFEVMGLLGGLETQSIATGQPRIAMALLKILTQWDTSPPKIDAIELNKKVDYLLGVLGSVTIVGLTTDSSKFSQTRMPTRGPSR